MVSSSGWETDEPEGPEFGGRTYRVLVVPDMTALARPDPALGLRLPPLQVERALLVPPTGPERPQPCGVFDAGDAPVLLGQCFSGAPDDPSTVFPEPRAPEEALAGTHLFGGVLPGHFGHILCEGLSRLWALDHCGPVDGVVFFARPFDKTRRVARGFAALAEILGLPPVRIVTVPTRVGRLILGEQGLGAGEMMSGRPESRAYLRRRFSGVAAEGAGRRLYITRSGLAARRGRLFDEAGLEVLFEAAGYEVVRPEERPLRDQIAMLRGASHVVGADGTPFHLLGFSAAESCRAAVIMRRSAPVYDQICHSLSVFTGQPPLMLDETRAAFSGRIRGNANTLYLEPSRRAMRTALVAAGFLPAETPDWPELDETRRAAECAALAREIGTAVTQVSVPERQIIRTGTPEKAPDIEHEGVALC
ncbi:MAG: glycosyltransferase 61 family protein [Paracoccaceae bacterium]